MPGRLSAEETEKLLGYSPRQKSPEQVAVGATIKPRRLSKEETAAALSASSAPPSKTKDMRPSTPVDPGFPGDATPEPDELGPSTHLGAIARGAIQGGTARFGDEIGAGAMMVPEAVGRLSEKIGLIDRPKPSIEGHYDAESAQAADDAQRPSIPATFRSLRDSLRADNKAAQAVHPVDYGLAEAGAGIALPVPGSGIIKGASLADKMARGGVQAASLGALYGAGGSEAADFGGVAKDAAENALASLPFGMAAGAASHGLGSLGERFGAKAKDVETGWRADKVAEGLKSANSAEGQAIQDAHRTLENIQSKLIDPNVSDDWKVRARAFLASDEGKALVQQVAESSLRKAPTKLGSINAARQAVDEAPMLANKAIDEELAQSTLKNDVLPRAWHYAKPAGAALLGGLLGGPAGAGAGGVLAAASGKPGRAIANLWAKPAFQVKLNSALETSSGALETALGAAGPALAAQASPEGKTAVIQSAISEDPSLADHIEKIVEQNQSKPKGLLGRFGGR